MIYKHSKVLSDNRGQGCAGTYRPPRVGLSSVIISTPG